MPPDAHDAYWRFLSGAFGSRQPLRRALQPALTTLQVKKLAQRVGFDPGAHARDLDARQWAVVFGVSTASTIRRHPGGGGGQPPPGSRAVARESGGGAPGRRPSTLPTVQPTESVLKSGSAKYEE